MHHNKAKTGGCIQLDSSSAMIVDDSDFSYNEAEIGGAFYAIANSGFVVSRSRISRNFGNDASAVYGMANNEEFALKFYDSVFENNEADQNLIHL